MNEIARGMQQMGFTQPGSAVKKQWVVSGTGFLGDLLRCGIGQLVGFALYKIVKTVADIQPGP